MVHWSILKSIHHKKDYVKGKYRIGKFPLLIPLYTIQTFSKVHDNYFTFENRLGDGAYYPYLGAFEWDRLTQPAGGDREATLYVYSHSLQVGPEANLYIRTLSNLMPDSDNVQLIFSAIIFVETRINWIEKNFNEYSQNKAICRK